MTAIPSREVTTSQITSVSFSFYTDDEIRKLSVKQITSPLTLDNMKNPIPNGLYDMALGPLNQNDTCGTCGLRYRACPGHFGHIELAVPVYNPLVFGTLYKLLRCVCLHCFKFRMAAEEVGRYEKRLALLGEGRLVEASRVTTATGAMVAKASNSILGDEGEDNDLLKMQGGSISVMDEDAGGPAVEKAGPRGGRGGAETVHTVEAARDCALEFFRRMPKGPCQNCGAFSPSVKKEGSSKIFQKPLPTKQQMQNLAHGVSIVSALAGQAHSDQEAEDLERQMAEHMAAEATKQPTAEDKEAAFMAAEAAKENSGKKDAKGASEAQDSTPAAEGASEVRSSRQRYMTPAEVREVLRQLWSNDADVLSHLYALDLQLGSPSLKPSLKKKGKGPQRPEGFKQAYQMFFVQTVAVPPNSVRPMSRVGDLTFEHPQNTFLTQIINYNLDILSLSQMSKDLAQAAQSGQQTGPVGGVDLARSLRLWLNMQNSVNTLFDSTTAEGNAGGAQGIRQILEKKEGLFRKNMMGKRVNFAARSVISPDPYLGSGEIGVPPYFAVRLSVPERVTPLNVQKLREMVIRGPHEHPGANAVEDENGRLLNLTQMSLQKREAIAKQLLSRQGTVLAASGSGQGVGGKIVYRHLQDGDVLLTNRQPTLHKPGLMAHCARVLKGERTIRMHYANCATFNADFDGDEINLHLPQDFQSRAEGYEIVHADHQYIVPTDGKPIRGLIQDHVVAGVLLTKRDTFLRRADFMQLVYSAVCPTRPGFVDSSPIDLPPPAILKPEPLWTGKQVVTAVVARLTVGKAPMTLQAKCKTSEKYWGKMAREETLVFHKGELLTGTMDKAQYGKYGLVHGVQELYGNVTAGTLLSMFSRLWTTFLQLHGFTCGIGDLLLQPGAEGQRAAMVAQAERRALSASAEYVGLPTDDIAGLDDSSDPAFMRKEKEVQEALSARYRSSKATGPVHDRRTTSSLQPITSDVVDVCLPGGLVKPFPRNCLSMMTVTGAKGSQVNFSQISCLLGQQELEGRRVPRMASGKTLPCFGAYEGGARSGGYISDRFLTGLRPQEFYFHCMAGREGLVDTTVKTSRSGYLQRCLVKNLESLRVHYDGTVRDNCDGSVVQFQYGEDGIDVLNNSFLRDFGFLARNAERLSQQQLPGAAEAASKAAHLEPLEQEAAKLARWRQRQLDKRSRGKRAEEPNERPPVSGLFPTTLLGVTSEAYADALGSFVRTNPGGELRPKKGKKRQSEGEVKAAEGPSHLSEEGFQRLMDLRYMRALVAPGEAVGVLAAQSVGEPSTQMTLNTFHMAGRGEANVTLGIPRLRELFMTAAQSIKTPVMTMPLLPGRTRAHAEAFANQLRRIRLAEEPDVLLQVLEDITIEEKLVAEPGAGVVRQYTLRLRAFPKSKLPKDAQVTCAQVAECLRINFMRRLSAAVKRQLVAFDKNAAIHSVTLPTAGGSSTSPAASPESDDGAAPARKASNKEDEDENEEENEENKEGKLRFTGGHGEKAAMYNEGDQEDKEIAAAQSRAAALRDELPEEEEDSPSPEAAPRQEANPEAQTPYKLSGGFKAGSQTLYNTEDSTSADTMTATISIPLTAPKVLMLELAERIAAATMLRHTPGIEKCYVIDGTKDPAKPDEVPPPLVQTDGINFEGAWCADDIIDINALTTNDVGSILSRYGVEAARATVMREVSSVFGAYGIAVDPRHLGLIADFMTHQGGYRACSRLGIESSKSTFLKITFETAAHFLTDATLRGIADDLASPASRIVMGRIVELGTGSFELLQKLEADDSW